MMQCVLILSSSEKATNSLSDMLSKGAVYNATVLSSCSEARQKMLERDFDLLIINSPLKDETGETLARQVAAKGLCYVILIVKNEFYNATCALCEGDGVLTVGKPVNKAMLWSAISFATAASNNIKKAQKQDAQLRQRIEDIRIIDRAKSILITHVGMDETEAHRHIEKMAMDTRCTRKAIAMKILASYDN